MSFENGHQSSESKRAQNLLARASSNSVRNSSLVSGFPTVSNRLIIPTSLFPPTTSILPIYKQILLQSSTTSLNGSHQGYYLPLLIYILAHRHPHPAANRSQIHRRSVISKSLFTHFTYPFFQAKLLVSNSQPRPPGKQQQ